MKSLLVFLLLFLRLALYAQELIPEFLWTGSLENKRTIVNRFDLKLTIPKAQLAMKLQLLDRRPAADLKTFTESFGGETADSAIIQPGFGLYHLNTGSRMLYGTLDTHGLPARTRNIWIRGLPYAESRTASGTELRTAPSSTAIPQFHTTLESPDLPLGQGTFSGFGSFFINNDDQAKARALGLGANYSLDKGNFRLEGYYGERHLPERRAATWFNQRHALPERNTQLFAGAMIFSIPAFGLAADLAHSETFAFGRDYYGSLGLRFGDKPWRISMAADAAGSRYVDSSGGTPGAGLRAGARLERRGKRTGLFRLSALARGSPAENFNRLSGELYYRFPVNSSSFGLNRFSFSLDRDGRDEKKRLDSISGMAALKLGSLNYVSEGRISAAKEGSNNNLPESDIQSSYKIDSFRFVQSFTLTIRNSSQAAAKIASVPLVNTFHFQKLPFTIVFSARAAFNKAIGKDGIWDGSISASARGKQNRFTVRVSTSHFPEKWNYTISWRALF